MRLPDPADGPVCDLVLEGGGVLGIAHVGALEVLAEAGYRFARVAGSSVGALVGSLVAGGMAPERVAAVLRETDLSTIPDRSLLDRVPVVGPLASVVLENGVFEGEALRRLAARLLREECGVETFADLALAGEDHLPPEQRYRLVVTATDTTRGLLVSVPWDVERDYGLDGRAFPVADAVRASASIPFYFEPVELRGADGRTSTLVDGGVLSNFPIDLLDRTDEQPPRWPTFGLKLLPDLPDDAARVLPPPLRPLEPLLHRGPLGLATDLVTTALVGRDQARLALPWVAARTIRIDTAGVSPVDFGLSDAQVEALLDSGRVAARTFLETWDWEDYLRRYRTRPEDSVRS